MVCLILLGTVLRETIPPLVIATMEVILHRRSFLIVSGDIPYLASSLSCSLRTTSCRSIPSHHPSVQQRKPQPWYTALQFCSSLAFALLGLGSISEHP